MLYAALFVSIGLNLASAIKFWRLRHWVAPAVVSGHFHAPTPDANRYLVVLHIGTDTVELFHGYDGLKARHAYEHANVQPGCVVEFYEWGERRNRRVV